MSRAFSPGAWAVALLVLCPLAAFAASSEDEAGDVSEIDKDALGPLRDRVPPVSGHLFLKKHRFELSPSATVSIRDAFFTKYVLGGTATFHITEAIALTGRFGYSIPTVSGSAQICIPQGGKVAGTVGCSSPTMERMLGVLPGAIGLLGGLDLQWTPLYGKLALFSEKFLHFDLYGIGGGAFVQYTGPSPDGIAPPATYKTFGANVGVGMHFFLNRWLSVRTELRDLIYEEQVVFPVPGSSIRNQLLFEVGISMFFPMGFTEN